MKKLCIICPWGYPIPAVKGGAVETLMQFFVEENEKNPNFEITLLTTWDEDAERIAQEYTYTKYVGFKYHERIDKCWEYVFRGIKKVFKHYILSSYEMIHVMRYLKKYVDEYDYVLLECGQSYMLPLLGKIVPKEKMLAHLHWSGDGNKRMNDAAGNILAVSKYVASEWNNAAKGDKKKIYVWNNCFNDRVFFKAISDDEKQRLKSSLGIIEQKVIIYTGRIIEGKGVLELIEAVNQISIDDIVLLLIGKANFGKNGTTPFEEDVQREIKKSKKKIIRLGFIKNEDLYKYYSISSLMVAPSKLKEAALLVNIEAMASGTPVISTKMGGIPEYVGDAGILIDVDENMVDRLADEIEKLFTNPQRLAEYSNKAKERANLFTRSQFYERFLEIINDIEDNKQCV